MADLKLVHSAASASDAPAAIAEDCKRLIRKLRQGQEPPAASGAEFVDQQDRDNALEALYAGIEQLTQQRDKAIDEKDLARETRDEMRTLFLRTLAHADRRTIDMQTAVIEMRLGAGAEAAMAWISNSLSERGLLPNLAEAMVTGGARAWFDAGHARTQAELDESMQEYESDPTPRPKA